MDGGVRLYPNNPNGGDLYGSYQGSQLAEKLKAKLIFLLNDLYILKNYRRLHIKNKTYKLIAYAPLDGYISNPEYIDQLGFLDALVMYAPWAESEIKKAAQQFNFELAQNILSIPHGIAQKVFYPQQIDNPQMILGKNYSEQTCYILNANRYNERKDLNTTLAGFVKAHPYFHRKTMLVLHTPNLHPLHLTELENNINSLGINDHVIINPLGNNYVEDEQLNKLYNLCEIGLNTSLGEGWGLISFEHALCQKAQIVPDHTSPGDHWKNKAVLVPVVESVRLSTNPFDMRRIDSRHLANSLVHMVNDNSYRNNIADKCYHFAKSPAFSWDHVCDQWINLFKSFN